MSMESDLATVLKAQCVRAFPDFAPINTVRPYITWQQIGGRDLRWMDKTAADKQHSLIQVNVWADTRASANTLARQIEAALCASTAFSAVPDGALQADADPDFNRYGTRQDFNIIALRT
jgi:hypothetical protein